jgi:phosphatidylserine/phosphatidylglycerophosphate/cardiolipin synthase-like enzyme
VTVFAIEVDDVLKINILSVTPTRWLRKREQFVVKIFTLFCVVSMLLIPLPWSTSCAHEVLLNNVVSVYFSPKGGCTEAIVTEIKLAKSEILVQAYSFTSREIANALADAHARGVAIQIILDKSQITARQSVAAYASRTGIQIFIDRDHAIAHSKVMIIDKLTVITGSFNFTKAAEEGNAENLLIVRSSALARLYTDSWTEHRMHSEKYRNQDAG